jgi:hypothetical protein
LKGTGADLFMDAQLNRSVTVSYRHLEPIGPTG